ncbi:MAG: hypothetical protein CME60_08210 [Halobacteriovoraceae bacterium]|nr:hypothetical protein [Halobacteriovoraceae bacterium]
MSLIKTISDQVHLGFTGRINILTEQTGKYLGRITLRDGLIVFTQFKERIGKSSLYHCLIEDLEEGNLKFAVEPEVVGDNEIIFTLDYQEFVDKGQKIFQAYKSSKKFRPPGHIKLMIDPDFIAKGQSLSYVEFELLSTISDYSRVSDIFNESKLLEYQVSNALVSLRQKGALKVIGKKK